MTTKSEFVDKVALGERPEQEGRRCCRRCRHQHHRGRTRVGREVSFTGFGKFHVAQRGAREGRNPRTGETMTIAASRVPRFTAGSGLKKAVK